MFWDNAYDRYVLYTAGQYKLNICWGTYYTEQNSKLTLNAASSTTVEMSKL